jgi:hypothetical protein
VITGRVVAREGRIRLTVRRPRRQQQEVEAVIDTGYLLGFSDESFQSRLLLRRQRSRVVLIEQFLEQPLFGSVVFLHF